MIRERCANERRTVLTRLRVIGYLVMENDDDWLLCARECL